MLTSGVNVAAAVTASTPAAAVAAARKPVASAAATVDAFAAHLSRADVNASRVGVAATSVCVQAVVDWLTLALLIPPPRQTLADVRCRACLHTFGLREVHTHRYWL